MKYLDEVAPLLEVLEPDPEAREELHRLLVSHDELIEQKVAQERVTAITPEMITDSMLTAIRRLVRQVCLAEHVPPGLADQLEEIFATAIERANARAREQRIRVPGGGGVH